MAITLKDKMKGLSAERRKKIEARAAQLIAEEMTLQDLRRARKITQVRMAKELGINQNGVSRIEKRSDLLLSTLRKTIEAMGGNPEPFNRVFVFSPAINQLIVLWFED